MSFASFVKRFGLAGLRLVFCGLVFAAAQPALAFPDAYTILTGPPLASGVTALGVVDTANDTLVVTTKGNHPITQVVFSPDGRWVYAMTSSSVYVVSTASNAIVAEIPIGINPGPVAIVMAPDGSVAYVTDSGDFATSLINVATGAVVTTVTGLGNIVAISPDGKTLYALTGTNIALFSTATYSQTGTIAVAGDTFALSPDGTRAFIGTTGQTQIQIVDTAAKTVTGTIQLGSANPLAGVAYTADGKHGYVTTAGGPANNVLVVDTAAFTVTHTFALPGNARPAVSFSPDGSKAYFLNYFTGTMQVVSTSSFALLDTVVLGGTPQNTAPFIGGKAAPAANFALTLSANAGGFIGSTPLGLHCSTTNAACNEDFAPGTVVTLAPVMLAGYTFGGWGGDCSGTGSCTVTMNAAHAVSANFVATTNTQTFNLSITATNGGIVQGTNVCATGPACPLGGIYLATSSVSYQTGQTANLTAFPMQGYAFAGWSGDCSGTARCFVTMNSAHTVTANFVPGTVATPIVTVPVPQTGYWWNPAQGGRGFNVEQRGGNLFMASFLYGANGSPTWFGVGPGAISNATYTGPLETYSGGQTLTGAFKPASAGPSGGNFSITFTSSTQATITWPGGNLAIQRYDFGPGGAAGTQPAGTPESGWWWAPTEGGRGYAIEVQGGSLFLAGYMYDNSGNPVWYASGPTPMTSLQLYQGIWEQFGNGQTLTGNYQPAAITTPNAGTVTIFFSTTTAGTLTFPDGRQVAIQRYTF